MPFMTHGTVSNWWYGVQSRILQSAMMSLGKPNAMLLGRNFLPIFYMGILFDLTVFLLGIWFLGRRYFKSRLTILFVAITALGSTVWVTQPWYSHHLYFALFLIFHFVHLLFKTGKWRYFFFAGSLFAIQIRRRTPCRRQHPVGLVPADRNTLLIVTCVLTYE